MKKSLKITLSLVGILIILLVFIKIGVDRWNDKMSRLPQGKSLIESTSPNKAYTIKTYLCGGGATVANAVRGELIIGAKGNNGKNIYWDYRVDKSEIQWLDNDTVNINGHIIDLPDGKYDWRYD